MEPNRNVIIAPSILSADFARLAEQIALVERGGAGWIHVDVMDGHFVPNITIGMPVVKSLRTVTSLPLDCHLMIERPDEFIPSFASAGADIITIHVEATAHLHRTVQLIKSLGKKAGVSLNPATPLGAIEEILPDVDMVLLMSVNPGFGGQDFIPSLYRRARELRTIIDSEGFDCLIEADGGIKLDNIAAVHEAGVDVIVSGSGIFGEADPAMTIERMIAACSRTATAEA